MFRFTYLLFPKGNIHPKYKNYVYWSFISNIFVSAETVLSSHSMLSAMDTSSSETIRTVNYIGKDIIGQIGSLGYMTTMGDKADKKPKTFILYSNILQQIGFSTMCITPFIPEYFLPIAGISNVLTNISFIGFGAINAKCIQKLAIDNNVGEIYAKISIVNTIGSSIGLLLGVGITTLIPDHNSRILFLPFLAFIRILTFNYAIRDLI